MFRGTAALLGAAVLPAVGPHEAVAAPEGDDAELIRLCDLFHQQHAALFAAPIDDDDAADVAMDARWETSGRIEDIRPATTKGMKAKAKVAVCLFSEAGLEGDGSSAQFALATLRDAAGEG